MELSEEQLKFINSEGNTILKAGPGSGKTLCVTTLINKKIREWKYDYRGIAIISFCNSSVDEIEKNVGKVVYPHFIGTIDSFVEKYIFYPFFKYLYSDKTVKPKLLIDDNKDFFKHIKINCKFKSICFKCKYEDIKIDSMLHTIPPREECLNNTSLPCKNYKYYLLKEGFFTYDDAISMTVYILKKFPTIAYNLARRFSLLIIDEAQDTSKIQMELIEIFEKNGSRIIIVGDSDQAIYEWRRANPEIFVSKYNSSKYNHIEFLENYRSSQSICNATYLFSTLSSTAKAVGKFKDYPEKPKIFFYNDIDEAISFFEHYCFSKQIKNKKILVRGNGIIKKNKYSEINDLCKNNITDLLFKSTILKSKGKTNESLNLIEKALFELFFKVRADNFNDMINIILTKFNMEEWKSLLKNFYMKIPSENIILSKWVVLMDGYINDVIKTNNINYIKIKKFVKSEEIKDFKEKELYYFDRGLDDEKRNIDTIHSAKGKTYEAVMLLISKKGKLTFNVLNGNNNDEERRIAYVAMTRPQKILVVAFPKSVKINLKKSDKFPEDLWCIEN